MANTVETRIKEPRFFFGSLKRFLIKWLLLQIPACKVLKEVLIYNMHLAHINTVLNTKIKRFFENSLRILQNSFRLESSLKV